MKTQPSPKKGRVAVELNRAETAIPASAVSDIQLKRILVPIDFSTGSKKALLYAASIARPFAAEITLIHVVQPVMYSQATMIALEATVDDTAVRDAATEELSKWRKGLAAPERVKAKVRLGTPHDQIVR